jgi:hypothetical protein
VRDPEGKLVGEVPATVASSGEVVWPIEGQLFDVPPAVYFKLRDGSLETRSFAWGTPMNDTQDPLNISAISPMKFQPWPIDSNERTRTVTIIGGDFTANTKAYIQVEGEQEIELETKMENPHRLKAILERGQLSTRLLARPQWELTLVGHCADGSPAEDKSKFPN